MPDDKRDKKDHSDAAGSIEKVDRTIGHKAAAHRYHPIAKAMGKIGEIGDQGPLYAIGAIVLGAGLLRKHPRSIATGLSMLAAVATADVLKSSVKHCVRRTRPKHTVEKGEYLFESGEPRKKEERSFPSGHAACTVAAANAVSRLVPRSKPIVRIVSAFLTGTRVLRGKHWPLDLLAGSAVGWLSERLIRLVTPRSIRRWFEG